MDDISGVNGASEVGGSGTPEQRVPKFPEGAVPPKFSAFLEENKGHVKEAFKEKFIDPNQDQIDKKKEGYAKVKAFVDAHKEEWNNMSPEEQNALKLQAKADYQDKHAMTEEDFWKAWEESLVMSVISDMQKMQNELDKIQNQGY